MQQKQHWENVYTTKPADSVSWFQAHAETSLTLIQASCPEKNAAIIDIGGGASTLIDDLVFNKYSRLAVLDLSKAALEVAKTRIGSAASHINWIEADITKINLPNNEFDLWHDRAVFHFLTEPEDRLAYVKTASHSLKNHGHLIISTFAEDGPSQCSGLPVMRHSAASLQKEFGDLFVLKKQFNEIHKTPFNTTQAFIYCLFEKIM